MTVRNSLGDTNISTARIASRPSSCDKIAGIFELNTDVAAGAGNTVRPLTPPTSNAPKEEAVSQPTQMGATCAPSGHADADPVPPGDARDYLITALDSIRKTEQSLRVEKPRFMKLARTHGFTNAEIGELLGVSEAAVRAAIKRAARGDA